MSSFAKSIADYQYGDADCYVKYGKEIISLAEKSKVLLEFTTLNNTFTDRLKAINKEDFEKNENEKRLKGSPADSTEEHKKKWRAAEE